MRQERIFVLEKRKIEDIEGVVYRISIATPSGVSIEVDVSEEDFERIKVGR